MYIIFPGDPWWSIVRILSPDQKFKVQNLRQFLPKRIAFVLFHDKKKILSDHHKLEDHDTWDNGVCTEQRFTAHVFLPPAAFNLPGLVDQFSLRFAIDFGHAFYKPLFWTLPPLLSEFGVGETLCQSFLYHWGPRPGLVVRIGDTTSIF